MYNGRRWLVVANTSTRPTDGKSLPKAPYIHSSRSTLSRPRNGEQKKERKPKIYCRIIRTPNYEPTTLGDRSALPHKTSGRHRNNGNKQKNPDTPTKKAKRKPPPDARETPETTPHTTLCLSSRVESVVLRNVTLSNIEY